VLSAAASRGDTRVRSEPIAATLGCEGPPVEEPCGTEAVVGRRSPHSGFKESRDDACVRHAQHDVGARDVGALGDRPLCLEQVLERLDGEDGIEGPIAERKPRRICRESETPRARPIVAA
jgi:hypothetical protein